jgi:hypothetical protein
MGLMQRTCKTGEMWRLYYISFFQTPNTAALVAQLVARMLNKLRIVERIRSWVRTPAGVSFFHARPGALAHPNALVQSHLQPECDQTISLSELHILSSICSIVFILSVTHHPLCPCVFGGSTATSYFITRLQHHDSRGEVNCDSSIITWLTLDMGRLT